MIGLRATLKREGVSFDALRKKIQMSMEAGIFEAARHVERTISKEVQQRVEKPRTGNLANSFVAQWVYRRGGMVRAGAYSDSIYARVQDEGMTIYPKEKKNLAIPAPGQKFPVGTWPRNFGTDFFKFVPRKGGGPGGTLYSMLDYLAMKRHHGSLRDICAYFILRPSVIIIAKNYLEAARAKAEPGVDDIMGHHVDIGISRWSDE